MECSEPPAIDEEQEVEALRRVLATYEDYARAAEADVQRWERSYSRLKPRHKELVPHLPTKYAALRRCIAANARFIGAMLEAFDPPFDVKGERTSSWLPPASEGHPGDSTVETCQHISGPQSIAHSQSLQVNRCGDTNCASTLRSEEAVGRSCMQEQGTEHYNPTVVPLASDHRSDLAASQEKLGDKDSPHLLPPKSSEVRSHAGCAHQPPITTEQDNVQDAVVHVTPAGENGKNVKRQLEEDTDSPQQQATASGSRKQQPGATVSTSQPSSGVSNSKLGEQVPLGAVEEMRSGQTSGHGVTVAREIPQADVDKVRCILRNIVRDWTREGELERQQTYGPILNELKRMFPDRLKKRCLIPGAGLARLAVEISRFGFICQGNEFSYYILMCSSFLLNETLAKDEWIFYPWIHNSCNNFTDEDQLRGLQFPDLLPSTAGITEDFSMCAGDFVEVYSHPSQRGAWDCVVTCFFIDTAHNVVEYMEVIAGVLREGGVWINFGPLLYHFADAHLYAAEDEMSIELALMDVRRIALQLGFTMVREEVVETTYTASAWSMMGTQYRCALWTLVKAGVPLQRSAVLAA
eukprot:SM000088S23679  [mRNA]  locus=s88:57375:60750:- [translate_table: standard]